MNPVVRAQLKAFVRANPKPQAKESELFEIFSIFAICNGYLTDNIDPFTAHLEGTDFGIDGVAIMVQGILCQNTDETAAALENGKNHEVEFNLFQAKTSESIDYGDLSKFFDGAYNFFTGKFVDASDQLMDLMAAKDFIYQAALKRNPKLRLFFVSTGSGEISKPIQQLIDSSNSRFQGLSIFESIEIHVIGAKELQSGYRSATNSIASSIEINKPITLPEHKSVQQAFLGFVSAEQLVLLATVPSGDEKTRRINHAVFFDNIRDFSEKSTINQSIFDELKDGGQTSFVFKNNGVTVVAKEIKRTGDTFSLEDFQIVNGCQTSNILFLAGNNARGVSVPFRLIGSNDSEFISSIIVGTNKQNEVREDQFWALTPFMKNLEEYSREQGEEHRIFVERRENQYRNETVERTRICKPRDLVKSIAAMYLHQPHRAARDYRGVIQEFSSKIFRDVHSVVPYHAAAYASYRTEFAIRNKRVPSEWGIYKYYLHSSIGQLLTKGAEIFSLKKSEQEKISNSVLQLFSDENELITHFKKVAGILDKMIASRPLATREMVRDFIRTDAASKEFEAEYAKLST